MFSWRVALRRCGRSRYHASVAIGLSCTASTSIGSRSGRDDIVPRILSRSRRSHSVSQPFSHCSTSYTQKLQDIHMAEEKVLDMMTNTAYRTLNVSVPLNAGSRCFLSKPETEYTIRTVIVGEEHRDKPPIVLIHGFMMGAAGFFKLLPLLAKHRTVYAIDIIGMGGSGRPPFSASRSSPKEAEDLLVEPFEEWAAAMGLTKFVLLGHSFGGFVASCWATRRPESVTHLGLLSPLLGFSDERIDRLTPKGDATWQQQAFYCLVKTAWAHHLTPQTLVRHIPGAKTWFERTSMRRFSPQGWVQGMTEEEGRLLSQYLVKTVDMPQSTESTATVCFGPLLRPVEVDGATIKERLSKLNLPGFVIYGDHDWMDKARGSELPQMEFIELANSGHHLYLDNPNGLASDILNRI